MTKARTKRWRRRQGRRRGEARPWSCDLTEFPGAIHRALKTIYARDAPNPAQAIREQIDVEAFKARSRRLRSEREWQRTAKGGA